MTEPTIAPYGAWESPFPISLLTAGVVALGEIKAAGGVRWWLEGRPDEKGRQVLVRRDPDGTMTRLTPEGFNARTRVQEYGGGAYLVDGDLSSSRTSRPAGSTASPTPGRARAADAGAGVALRRPGRSTGPATASSRSARTTSRRRSSATARPRTRSSRSTSTSGDGQRSSSRAPTSIAAPRLSPDGTQPRVAGVAPPEHALGRHGAAGRRRPRRRLRSATREHVAGSPSRLDHPAALVARRRPPLRRRARRLDEPRSALRRRPDRADRARRGRVRLARLAVRLLELRLPGRRLDHRDRPERRPRPAATASRAERRTHPPHRRCRSPRSAASRVDGDIVVLRARSPSGALGASSSSTRRPARLDDARAGR